MIVLVIHLLVAKSWSQACCVKFAKGFPPISSTNLALPTMVPSPRRNSVRQRIGNGSWQSVAVPDLQDVALRADNEPSEDRGPLSPKPLEARRASSSLETPLGGVRAEILRNI